jgi:excisionase family DNA binding protein
MKYETQNNADWLSPKFYTVKEAAVVLRYSEKTIRRLLDRGILRSTKATRKKLIPREDIESFFERTC